MYMRARLRVCLALFVPVWVPGPRLSIFFLQVCPSVHLPASGWRTGLPASLCPARCCVGVGGWLCPEGRGSDLPLRRVAPQPPLFWNDPRASPACVALAQEQRSRAVLSLGRAT